MTPLLSAFLERIQRWEFAFSQQRSFNHARLLSLGFVLVPGLRMISRVLACLGFAFKDWSASYRFLSRSKWEPRNLFAPIIAECVSYCQSVEFIPVGGDFSHLRKSGSHIANVQWTRDPLSPPFHTNLIRAMRFMQLSILLPLYHRDLATPPRSIPTAFKELPAIRKPRRTAPPQEHEEYRRLKNARPTMHAAVVELRAMRDQLDQCGVSEKMMLAVLDGSFCNLVVFCAQLDRVDLLCRCRKDARLCFGVEPGGQRFYSQETFTPEEVRRQEHRPYQHCKCFHGGAWRDIRYKELGPIYWRHGAKRRPLRLIVIAPTPYRRTKTGKTYYREPAYLLTTDCRTPAAALIQAYLDRWQLEVNHREEKTTFGIGDPQVRNANSVTRQPALAAATYANLHLAALAAYGSQRSEAYLPLPKWRRKASRPSCQDIIDQVRREAHQPSKEDLHDVIPGFSFEEILFRAAA